MTSAGFSLLPSDVLPLHYRVTLAPNLVSFTFRGQESIALEVKRPVSQIVLNAAEIQVQTARAVPEGGVPVAAERILYDESAQTVTFAFARPVPAGRVRLELEFTGQLNDRLHGFYRSRYQGADGKERFLAATQFEATDARRAFPSFDEPALKATFQVNLDVPSHLAAVSNTPVVSERVVEPGTKRVAFAETPRMSTYLLAFLVGELESIETRAGGGTLVRVWTTPGRKEQGRFALETSMRLLAFFTDYFGIPYPLAKLDHIAIPDFAAGAMENWGAITYRETALLVDPQSSAAGTRQRVAEVVSHEMAHMWFGDLVTMQWWNDLWLNESFASWMGDKAVNHLFPEWDMWTQFIVNDTNAGLALDGLKSSHPIDATVRDPAEVQELFDAISYSKGASIIRMLEHFVGEETFRQGLHSYLEAHKYGNAQTADLWKAMEEASRQPVTAMMRNWTAQMGYPVLQAEMHRNRRGVEVGLSQRRFVYDQQPQGAAQDATVWQVPVNTVGQGASGTDRLLLARREGSLRLKESAPRRWARGWVKVNAAQMGFYRVNYAPEEWAKLISAIQAQELTPADRLGLQGDAYALARAGLLPATQYMALAQAFKGEQSYPIWSDLSINLQQVESLLAQEEFLPRFLAFGRDLYRPVAGLAGWDPQPGEGHLRVLLRSIVLGRLGGYGEAAVVEEARRRFAHFQKDPASLSPDLRAMVYGLVAQEGDEAAHDTFRELARKAPLHEEKLRLLAALTRFSRKDLLQRTLELTLSPEVRSQDTVLLVMAVAGNRHGRDLAWAFVKDRWPVFDERYGRGGFTIMRLVGIGGGFTRPEDREDVERFFRDHPVPAAARTVQQSLERIGLNVRWLERNRKELEAYLAGLAF